MTSALTKSLKLYSRLTILGGTASFLVLTMPAVSLAQTNTAKAKPMSNQPEEIVVTARKIEEKLQDAPVSVTAFSARNIENQGISSINDLAKQTPGLSYEKSFGRRDNSQNFTIRGVSNVSNAALNFPSVANFIDGVFVPGSLDGYDLSQVERVEIIRGPQSAVYGRATESGAINYVTKRPNNDWNAMATGSYATFNDAKAFVRVGGPLVADRLFFSASYRSYSKDGQYPNIADGGRKTGAESSQSFSGSLRFTPIERLDATLRIYYNRDRDEQPAFGFSPGSADNCFLTTYPFYCGTIKSNGVVNMDRKNILFDGLKRADLFGSLSISYDLGRVIVTSITGYDDNRVLNGSDTSYNNFLNGLGGFDVVERKRDQSTSQEIRLAGAPGGPLNWQVGYFYYNQDSHNFNVPTLAASNSNYASVKSNAFFGQLGYDILPNLEASIEGRYSKDDIGLRNPFGVASATAPISPWSLTRSFSAFTPRFILNWKVMPDAMVYASASRGTKPGGFNAVGAAPAGSESYLEEKIWAYELGAKTSWLDNRVTANVALYYNELQNQQLTLTYLLPTGSSTSYNVNAGRSHTQGVELEGRVRVVDQLNVSGSVSFNEGKFDDYAGIGDLCLLAGQSQIVTSRAGFRTLQPLASCLTGPAGNGKGKTLPKAPKVLGSLTADWTAPLSGSFNYFIRPSVTYRAESFVQVDNLTKVPSATIANLRIGVENDKYQFTIFGNNLNNNKSPTYVLRYLDFAKLVPGTTQVSFLGTSQRAFPYALPNKPQVGVSATVRY